MSSSSSPSRPADCAPRPSPPKKGPSVNPLSVARMSTRQTDASIATQRAEALEEQVQALEAMVERLDLEKTAIKHCLNQVEYFQQFNLADCKKWLAANFDFDRKDSPALLAAIFESYLMHSDDWQPLPHQLIVKNSTRAESRRVRERQSRQPQRAWQKPRAVEITPTETSNKRRRTDLVQGKGEVANNVLITAEQIEELYAAKPWSDLQQQCPDILSTHGDDDAFAMELQRRQRAFLDQNACAIWERSHWLSFRHDPHATPDQTRHLMRLNNRRKKRQQFLKARLEHTASELQACMPRRVLQQSMFCELRIEAILSKPRAWFPPAAGMDLACAAAALDAAEPSRCLFYQPLH